MAEAVLFIAVVVCDAAVMPQVSREEHNRFSTVPLPEAEREAAAALRMTLGLSALSLSMVVAGVVSWALDSAGPLALGSGWSLIVLLASLNSLCAPAEVSRILTIVPALGSQRLRFLRLAETGLNAATTTLLFAGGTGLICKSIFDLLRTDRTKGFT